MWKDAACRRLLAPPRRPSWPPSGRRPAPRRHPPPGYRTAAAGPAAATRPTPPPAPRPARSRGSAAHTPAERRRHPPPPAALCGRARMQCMRHRATKRSSTRRATTLTCRLHRCPPCRHQGTAARRPTAMQTHRRAPPTRTPVGATQTTARGHCTASHWRRA
eukprot:274217-Chlamydomonas_euryale.AAC.12